ncbi:MAG: hypothetical protein NXI24_14535 [bacterium]|nr:hypothetical protein [bacterium]
MQTAGNASTNLFRSRAGLYGLALFVFCLTSNQAPSGGNQIYQGDIREDDLRVSQIFAQMRERPGENPPEELRLRYGGPRGDYLSFYDLEGRDIYFRYREDRFDRRADKKVRELIEGQAFRVRGEFRGVLVDGVFYPAGRDDYPEALREAGAILAYSYTSAFPLRMEQILY